MDIRKSFVSGGVKHWHGLPGEVVDVQETWICDTEECMWFSGHGGDGLTFGLGDLRGLFQPK